MPRTRTVRNLQISFGVLLILLIALLFAKRQYVSRTPIDLNQSERLRNCRVEIFNTLNAKNPDIRLLGSIHGLCYARVDEEDVLEEFGVRRAAYINQQYQVPIMLWMVVAITLSGVALAALQLWAGYKLALTGQNGQGGFEPKGELTIEPKKLSVSSSVTGVLILTVSLAFFYVFVRYVYLITDLHVPAGESEAGGPDLHAGWGNQKQSAPPMQLTGTFPPPNSQSSPASDPKKQKTDGK